MSKRRFFSGASLEQALLQAASHFHVEPGEITYREREKKHGVAKSRRAVIIEVDPAQPLRSSKGAGQADPAKEAGPAKEVGGSAKNGGPAKAASPTKEPERAERTEERPAPIPRPAEKPRPASLEDAMVTLSDARGAHAPRPAAPAPTEDDRPSVKGTKGEGDMTEKPRKEERDDEDEDQGGGRRRRSGRGRGRRDSRREVEPVDLNDEAVLKAAKECSELLVRLAGLELEVEVRAADDHLEIELSGEDEEDATAEDGEVLEALEYLAPRMMHGVVGSLVHCRVDCDGFRAEREEDLADLAQEAAEKVRSSGRPRTLEPMNPADRRLVHMALAEERGVATESVGDGFFKRVTIVPS